MRTLVLAVLIIAGLFPGRVPADQPHYYMLLEPGNERWYEGRSTWEPVSLRTSVTHYDGEVSIMEVEYYSPYAVSWIEGWLMDDTGDVWKCNPGNPDERTLFLDLPLTPGKTWGTGSYPQGFHRYTVAGEVEVNTCFGLLTCMQIDWREWYPGYPEEHHGYYRFHNGYGFVEFLYSDGFHIFEQYGVVEAVVMSQKRSWSQIKSLFR